ncbi:MAG TPA: hypothetical protein VM778_05870 [Gemmatimonadota bacterium]|nr:hypothetical protein [Gemmatimonadota bacterium]
MTPAKYVGPAMVVLLLLGGAAAGALIATGRVGEAMVALLFAIGFLLLVLADLLGELIMLTRNAARGPATDAAPGQLASPNRSN